MSGLSIERAVLASISLGISKTSLKIALEYSKERIQFGKPISKFQMIQDKLATMYTETKASHLLVYWALSEIQNDHKKIKKQQHQFYLQLKNRLSIHWKLFKFLEAQDI